MFDHLVIEMKNKGYKPGPASSFFWALCATQVGLGIRPDIGGSFGGGFSAENFWAPWDQTKQIQTALWHPVRQQNESEKKNREEKVYANSVVRQYSMLP